MKTTNKSEPASPPSAIVQPHRHRAFTMVEMLVVLAVIGVLAGLLLSALGRAKSKAHRVSCLNNLRQLGVAIALYADDHNQRLPSAEPLPSTPVATNPPLPGIRSVLNHYVGNADGVFRCPEDRVGRFRQEGTSYEWNFAMNGRSILSPQLAGMIPVGPDRFLIGQLEFAPSDAPLLYDYENFHFPNRAETNGTRAYKNAVFADGHVGRL
jgi:prepilin-type N-terminal cleavage/methylation domain-containing protein/prepilin-type processing-associated H-X9-DG protein